MSHPKRQRVAHPVGATDLGNGLSLAPGARWTFGNDTADVFDAHVEMSVPGYRAGHAIIRELSDFHIADGARIIDIGCSTGTLIRQLATRHHRVDATFIGVDIEPRMAAAARQHTVGLSSVQIIQQDAEAVDYRDASLVILYYTLQFMDPHRRLAVLSMICKGMRPGGGVVLFEKTRLPDGATQDIFNQLYDSFKLHGGFAPKSVIGKQRSLRGVLTPLTSDENEALLLAAGFGAPQLAYKNLHFEGMYARRPVLEPCNVYGRRNHGCSCN